MTSEKYFLQRICALWQLGHSSLQKLGEMREPNSSQALYQNSIVFNTIDLNIDFIFARVVIWIQFCFSLKTFRTNTIE
jgi:hypothetical protein